MLQNMKFRMKPKPLILLEFNPIIKNCFILILQCTGQIFGIHIKRMQPNLVIHPLIKNKGLKIISISVTQGSAICYFSVLNFLIIFNSTGKISLQVIMINCISDKFVALQKKFPVTPYIYSLVGNSCIGLMQCATKLLTAYMSTNYILYLRASLLIIINTFVMVFMGGPIYIRKTEVFVLIMIRTILSSIGLILNFYSIKYISLSVVNAVWMTSPIWTNFIEAIYLKNPITSANVITAVICFSGLVLITKPQFIFGDASSHNPYILFCSTLVLIGSIATSLSMVIVRKLRKQITNLQNLQHFYYGQIIMNVFVIIFQGSQATKITHFSWKAVVLIFFLVASAYSAQLMVTRSIYLKSASQVGVFSYALIVVTLVIDILVFDESMDWLSFLGVIIIASSLFVVLTR